MLKRYLFIIFLYTIFLYAIIGVIFYENMEQNLYIYCVNLYVAIIYCLLIIYISKSEIRLFDLIIIVFVFNLVFVGVYNYLFYLHNGDFFAFSAADSISYHNQAKDMSVLSIFNFLNGMPADESIDNYGFPVYMSLLYRIFDSNLFVNFFNIILQSFSVLFLYKIGENFLYRTYNQIACLIFGIATFAIFYLVSGLKEPLMLFFVIFSYYLYFKFIKTNRKKFLFCSIVICLMNFFFRVPLVFFVFISFMMPEVMRLKLTKRNLFISATVIIVSFLLLNFKFELLARYLNSLEKLDIIHQATFSTGFVFTYITSFISGFFGPFPTLVPVQGYENLSVFAGSLILKVFLSIYFIIGVYLLFRSKFRLIYPIVFFSLFEILALIAVLEPFELRKCYPHIPFVILIAIYGFQCLAESKCKYIFLRRVAFGYTHFIVPVIFLWNYLRL